MPDARASDAVTQIIDRLSRQTVLQPLSFERAVSGYGVTRGWEYATVRCCADGDPSLAHAPKLLFAVLRDGDDLSGHVIDIVVSSNDRGSGSRLWEAVRDAAWETGLGSVRLETRGAGGAFWAKHGFVLDDAAGDSAGVLRVHRERSANLAAAGFPVTDEYLAWAATAGAAEWLALHGIQALWAHLPGQPGPALAEDGTPLAPEFQATVRSTVLFGTVWNGVLNAPAKGAGRPVTQPLGDA